MIQAMDCNRLPRSPSVAVSLRVDQIGCLGLAIAERRNTLTVPLAGFPLGIADGGTPRVLAVSKRPKRAVRGTAFIDPLRGFSLWKASWLSTHALAAFHSNGAKGRHLLDAKFLHGVGAASMAHILFFH